MSLVAEEDEGLSAAALLGMPGPWSLNTMVLPLSRMAMVGSMNEAWMRFSTSSRMSMNDHSAQRSEASLYTVSVISSR